jgi:tricarballylate dehydrogenase
MVGGLFYFNYASGTGLVSGALFGRVAGAGAAAAAARVSDAAEAAHA